MRKRYILFISILCIGFIIVGCTSKMTDEEYVVFVTEIHADMKDVISFVETNLAVSEEKSNRQVIVGYIEPFAKDVKETIKNVKKRIPTYKQSEFQSIYERVELDISVLDGSLNYTYDIGGKDSISSVLTRWKEITNYDENVDNTWVSTVVNTFDDKIYEFMNKYAMVLNWKDVQYDMGNNLDKKFVVAGIGELDDYYNYGFDDIEKDYFCVQVIPPDRDFTDSWYLYFHRESFKELFNKLMVGNVNMITICEIPSSVYKQNQGNMALVTKAQWY